MTAPFVIVGGGFAAATAARTLREEGYDGPLVLYAGEPHVPYERPPLSKDRLMGKGSDESLRTLPAEWYDDNDVELRLGVRVESLDPGTHMLRSGGEEQLYAKLLIATGASPRRMPMADASGAPIAYLRTVEDSDLIKSRLVPGARIGIIGGGFLGLEVAAAARVAGADVTLIEVADFPLQSVLGPEIGSAFADLHRQHGVDLRLAARLTGIERADEGAMVWFGDGRRASVDLLVVGIGAIPNTALAEDAGLRTDNGIVTDEHLRSSAPDVFAAGDVANALHPKLGRQLRVEHWDNAHGQGRAAALNMLGAGPAYDATPYFFTDQYDLGMEYIGNVGPAGYAQVVVRGDPESGSYLAFWLADGVVLAAMQVNDWDATDTLRRIVGVRVPEIDQLGDPEVPLSDLATLAE